MKRRDPKEYWKFLNDRSSLDSSSNVNLPMRDAFVDYFERLGSVPEEDIINPLDPFVIDVNVLDNAYLNSDITRDEVNKAVRKLKNNKACGFDLILN